MTITLASTSPHVIAALHMADLDAGLWHAMIDRWAAAHGVDPVTDETPDTLGTRRVTGLKADRGAGDLPGRWRREGDVLRPVTDTPAYWELLRLRRIIPAVPGLPWCVWVGNENAWPIRPACRIEHGTALAVLPDTPETVWDGTLWGRV